MGEKENQPDGIHFSDMHGYITILDVDDNAGDEDSNASDESFTLNKEDDDSADEELEVDEPEPEEEEFDAGGAQADFYGKQ